MQRIEAGYAAYQGWAGGVSGLNKKAKGEQWNHERGTAISEFGHWGNARSVFISSGKASGGKASKA